MKGYQFAHVETWSVAGATGEGASRKSTRGQGQRAWTAAEVLDEAERVPGSCGHVDPGAPRPQVWAGSCASFDELRAAHAAAAETRETFDYTCPKSRAKTQRSRKLRRDARSLYTAVFSLPVATRDALADPELRARCERLLAAAIAHEAERVAAAGGAHAMSVLHWDEAQVHAHFYALDRTRGRVNALHPGVAAKEAFVGNLANQARLDKKRLNEGGDLAYKRAMRGWQDDLHAEVFEPAGLLRFGPKRGRLSRVEWLQTKQAAAERTADVERGKRLDGRAQILQRVGAELVAGLQDLEALTTAIDLRETELDADQDALLATRDVLLADADDQALRTDEIAGREALVAAREAEITAQEERVSEREERLAERERDVERKAAAADAREREADAMIAAVEALTDGVVEVVEVDGRQTLRPSGDVDLAARWPDLKVRMARQPKAADETLKRVWARMKAFRDQAREDAEKKVATLFEKLTATWDTVADLRRRFLKRADRLPPEDRQAVEELEREAVRLGGAMAAATRDVAGMKRGQER